MFRKLAGCLSCNHFQVAERSLYLWNNQRFLALLNQHIDELMPILFTPMYTRSLKHWNRMILNLVNNSLRALNDINPMLFDDLKRKYQANEIKVRSTYSVCLQT